MADILKIREITIDTMQHKDFNIKEEELKLIRFYQNDLNSAKLLINVTHDKVVTDFSSATSVQIAFLKPDCKRVFQDVQNVNQMQGKYYVVLSTQTLIAYGNVIAQLRFTFPNNKVIETCKFAFTVDESIMSDDAMKSTNEFPVIQKAIEAGKKFEGVDIDGIIAAGELAKGALPKTGGTMTGNLMFDVSGGNKLLGFRRADGKQSYLYGGDDVIGVYSSINDKTPWRYIPSTDTFDMLAGKTNLLKKTGDTATGHIIFKHNINQETTDGLKGVNMVINSSVNKWSVAPKMDGNPVWANEFAMDLNTGKVTVPSLATKKDGRADLTLTADATTFDAGYSPAADRRGNTVTLRMAIQRVAGSSSRIVTTLPTDMRPTVTIVLTVPSTDGTMGKITITTTGEIWIESSTATSILGKNLYIYILRS